jgi:FtsP/CotA-like multicopper oxidase with cupredoxin domain
MSGPVRLRTIGVLVALAALAPMLLAFSLDSAGADRPQPLGPGLVTIELDMRYSRFSTNHFDVYEGTLVRFEVANDDPIHHEFIIGTDGVHQAHESGHDKHHPPVPGEVSVDPGQRGLTTFRFDQPVTITFACHLPGHQAYGMTGTVTVVPVPAPIPVG